MLRQPGVYTSGTVPFHRLVDERTRADDVQPDGARSRRLRAGRLASVAPPDDQRRRARRSHRRDGHACSASTAQRSLEVGPALGVNYAVTADGRNVARGHWARVHDQPGVVTTTGTPSVGQRDLYDLDLDGTFETVVRHAGDHRHDRRTGPSIPTCTSPTCRSGAPAISRQFAGGVAANVDVAHRRFVDRPTLVEINGKYNGRRVRRLHRTRR